MKKIISLVILFSICSCRNSKSSHRNWDKLIEGKWELTNRKDQVNYPTIEFTNGGAVFNSLADTIYGFSCEIGKNNNLILNDGYKINRYNKILKLTADSLIFETLLENTTPQVYVRNKKE